MWDGLVELVRASIFAGAHVFGGSIGTSVVVVSTLVRLALMPLVLRTARRGRAQQAIIARLAPQLEVLKRRHQSDPRRLLVETQTLYAQHGVRMFTFGTVASFGIQFGLLGALFSAVRRGLGERARFLWIADLSRTSALLVVLVSSITGVAALLAPVSPGSPATARMMVVVSIGGALAFLWSASSAVALSVGAGAATSVFQNWLLRRDARREAAV